MVSISSMTVMRFDLFKSYHSTVTEYLIGDGLMAHLNGRTGASEGHMGGI